MSDKVTILNTKNIKNLEFTLPDKKGVYLLVGPNGVGKTTLLVCLDRIGNSLAFANNFKSTVYSSTIDQYKESKIIYEIGDLSLTFQKKSSRLALTPKGRNNELTRFGYNETIFIQADSRRIDIPIDEIRDGRFETVSSEVKDSLNYIFETQRFSNLQKLRNTYGRGRKVQFFYVIKDGTNIYSEKRFSTGETVVTHRCAGMSV